MPNMQANDKFNINSQNEPLQAKNITTEQADLNNNVDDGEADLNNNVDDAEADLNNNVGTRQAVPNPFQWALDL
ncbi:hypothetical protein TIFTF001_004354 [Ficus carica]|uniref:Uncharacterized protein n=1 Tax=Ficus carica TaxID=3494 RepID=A0AA87ZHI1_FICCA|nr:hypothetical protein TIFTF001_004354 [Ficus carica]